MADFVPLDHSDFFKSIPLKSLGDEPASKIQWAQVKFGCGILLRDGRESRYGSSNSILLGKKLKSNQDFGNTDISNRIEFKLPRADRPTIKNGKKYLDRYEVTTLENGNIKIVLDLYRKYLDTGGYFTRKYAEIILSKDGEILFIDAKDYLASRWFMIFGSIGKFKIQKKILCGSR
jgi:hypothetical protein